MKDLDRKQYFITGLVGLVALAAGAYGVSNIQTSDNNSTYNDWKKVPLEDVSTEEEYTVAELEKPLLVETFAVWCPTCTKQQQEVKKFHKESNVTSVSLNVDSNEDAKKVRDHIQTNEFDWRYSIAPTQLTKLLVNKYGNSVLVPPQVPMILVCKDGERKLPQRSVRPVSKLQEEVNKGC